MITKEQADTLKELIADNETYLSALSYIDSLTGQEPAAVPPSRGETVLVELNYQGEDTFGTSLFYNENTNRLIPIDRPRYAKQEVIVEINGGVLAEVYTDNPDLIKVTLVDWDNIEEGDRAVEFGACRISDMPRSTREVL